VKFFLEPAVDWVEEELETLKFLCGAGDIDAAGGYQAPAGTPAFLTPLGKMYMPLEGLVDITAERARISKESGRMKKDLDQIVGKLANAKFIERAPKDVVEETKKRRESLKMSIGQLEEMLESLS
jgi:valyl-tRNA synthetase